MKLVIISHTEHYKDTDGRIVGWGPTVTEINHLMAIFDTIVHLAMLHPGSPPKSALPYTHSSIEFVPIPVVGGSNFKNKIGIVTKALKTIALVHQHVTTADYFQLRTPTGIGVYLIPYLSWFVSTPGWYKYAGNWNQKSAPLGYAIQRWCLKHQSRKVTINGAWPNQDKHCFTFENPCLTLDNLIEGEEVLLTKTFSKPINLCYVGRLETPKGVGRIIEAISALKPEIQSQLGVVHLVGDGTERDSFEQLAALCDVNFQFHGFLDRKDVFAIYKSCHGFLMPTTASEGFPKVLAEAMNFGCIPIVSNVSAIGQYIIPGKTGFVLSEVNCNNLVNAITAFVNSTDSDYQHLVRQGQIVVKRFTFDYYNTHIKQALLN